MKLFIFGWIVSCIGLGYASADEGSKKARAELLDSHGNRVGTVVFTQEKEGVKIRVQAAHLPPGKHGIHIHEKGECKGPKFESAGGHFHLEGTHHGLKNPEGPHQGDLENLEVKPDGSAHQEWITQRVSLENEKNSLLKEGGTAIVIHAGPDDQMSDPSGKSGDRIACGVITR
jgi:superoxide dismutase, Cu-Zn family